MKILARYISIQFFKNFATALIGISVLFFVQAVMGALLEESYPADKVLTYHLLSMPQASFQLVGPSVMIAVLMTLSNFNRSHELIAMYSLGIGLRHIVGVLMAGVFLICCASLMMNDRVLPPLFQKQTIYYWRELRGRNDFFLDVRKNRVWYRSEDYIYNLETFDSTTSRITGMSVYAFDQNFRLVQLISAKSAEFQKDHWVLHEGTVTVFGQGQSIPNSKAFDKKVLSIREKPDDFKEIEKEVKGLRLREFAQYIARMQKAGADTAYYETQLQGRISMSFIPLIMALLAIPFAVKNRRQGGVARDLGLCLVFTFFYWLFYSLSLSLGSKGMIPAWVAAWAPSLIFLLIAGALGLPRRARN